jgi:tetratricopeptide (TPR) repeat protein
VRSQRESYTGFMLVGILVLAAPSCKKVEQASQPATASSQAVQQSADTVFDGLLQSMRLQEADRFLKTLPERVRLPYICRLKSRQQDIRATQVCQEASSANPKDLLVVAALATALIRDRRTAEAEALMEKTYPDGRLDEGFLKAYLVFHNRQRRLQRIVKVLEENLLEAKSFPWVQHRLIQALQDKGRGDLLERRFGEASTAFRRLLELAPNEHAYRFHLATAYESMGKPEAAVEERLKARKAGATPPPTVDSVR